MRKFCLLLLCTAIGVAAAPAPEPFAATLREYDEFFGTEESADTIVKRGGPGDYSSAGSEGSGFDGANLDDFLRSLELFEVAQAQAPEGYALVLFVYSPATDSWYARYRPEE